MDFRQLTELHELPEQDLTARLVALFSQIRRCHDAGNELDRFDWRDVNVAQDGSLSLDNINQSPVTDDGRTADYHNYAAVIYCITTKQKSAEAMSWDADRKIKQPVLREIVLTFCGRNTSVEPLLQKLAHTFIDNESFFQGYTTVDQHEAAESQAKADEILRRNRKDEVNNFVDSILNSSHSKNYGYRRQSIGIFIFMFLCVGGYRVYKANQQREHDSAVIENQRILEESRQIRQHARSLDPVILKNLADKDTTATETAENN